MENGQAPDVGTFRYLKMLVTVLTVTMILGFLTIVALFVMRFSEMGSVDLPNQIILPEGATATAFTQGDDWFAVVTSQNEILIYSNVNGSLRQRITIADE